MSPNIPSHFWGTRGNFVVSDIESLFSLKLLSNRSPKFDYGHFVSVV